MPTIKEILRFENTETTAKKSDTFISTSEFRVIVEHQEVGVKVWLYGDNAAPTLLEDSVDLAGNSGKYWIESSGQCRVRVLDLRP